MIRRRAMTHLSISCANTLRCTGRAVPIAEGFSEILMKDALNTIQPGLGSIEPAGRLAKLLQLSPGADGAFVSARTESNPAGTIFGGVLIGQLMSAACQGVEAPAVPHHVQLNFLAPGRVDQAMRYEVRRLLSGRSFTVQQVIGTQGERTVVSGQVSFQRPELGPRFEQPMPGGVEPPETLPTLQDMVRAHAEQLGSAATRLSQASALEFRLPDRGALLLERNPDARVRYWVKVRETLPDDARLHACAFGYQSDYWFPITALTPHLEVKVNHGLQITSLNHAIWLHRTVCADDWLLVDAQSPASGGARGLSMGHVYDRQGHLVATLAQENLCRGWVEEDGVLVPPRRGLN